MQRRLLGLRTYRLAGFAVGIRPAVVAGVASALGRMAAGLMAHVEAV